jgi:hypothetical protein
MHFGPGLFCVLAEEQGAVGHVVICPHPAGLLAAEPDFWKRHQAQTTTAEGGNPQPSF